MKKKIERILNEDYVYKIFKEKKDFYFPSLKKRGIVDIAIKRVSPDWMKKSCLARYKITFSDSSQKIVRATAHIDDSKAHVYEIMRKLHSNGFDKRKFQIPKPLDYLKETKVLLYEEVHGTPLALAIEKNKAPLKVIENTAKFLARLHAFKKIKSPAIILNKKDYQRAFRRIKKILPSYEKYFIPLETMPFIDELKRKDSFIHGDLYSGNIIISEDKTFFIDLDKAGKGPLFIDIAPLYFSLEFPKIIWSINLPSKKIKEVQKVFLENYCLSRKLSFTETKKELEKFKPKIFLDALHFVSGFAYHGWPKVDDKAKNGFSIKLKELLIKINEACKEEL